MHRYLSGGCSAALLTPAPKFRFNFLPNFSSQQVDKEEELHHDFLTVHHLSMPSLFRSDCQVPNGLWAGHDASSLPAWDAVTPGEGDDHLHHPWLVHPGLPLPLPPLLHCHPQPRHHPCANCHPAPRLCYCHQARSRIMLSQHKNHSQFLLMFLHFYFKDNKKHKNGVLQTKVRSATEVILVWGRVDISKYGLAGLLRCTLAINCSLQSWQNSEANFSLRVFLTFASQGEWRLLEQLLSELELPSVLEPSELPLPPCFSPSFLHFLQSGFCKEIKAAFGGNRI